ncbi:MAG: EscU/YscU/HrcU family type III secretion system export apparatus switch protein [Treponema sp.]|nr:EscU/YscU/HrcU family type III secretion system export apparatus switch protein [Treponema sp.]
MTAAQINFNVNECTRTALKWSQLDLQWFAAEDEGRTEDPTQTQLDRARKEGRVAKSQEFNGALVFLFAIIVLIISASSIFTKLLEVYKFYFSRINEKGVTPFTHMVVFLRYFLSILLPIAVVAVVGGFLANIVQNRGFLFSTKPITPKFNKILPHIGDYLKRTMFSKLGVFNIIKSVGKVAFISIVCFNMIKNNLPEILVMIQGRGAIAGCISQIASMASKLLIFAAIFSLVVAIPDYYFQRKEFMEQMKMTREQVKQEYKEMEGDPEVKSHLEQAKRQMLSRNIPKAVAESDVVITNPTHYAVALKYDTTIDNSAPIVNAKGEDELAQTIKRFARENDVPIVENRPLARGLYTDVKIGDIIPDNYWTAISIVYSKLEKFKNYKK